MKKSIRLLIVFISILFTFPGMAQNENYDAVYQKLSKSYTLNPDGSIDYRFSKSQKLQTYLSINRLFGETFIIFDPDFQTLKIDEAYTLMADGKKVIAPENAFNEVLPRFARKAPAFNHLREMVVTHTGLEIGSIINLEFTIQTQNEFFPALMGTEVLAETQPVDKMTINVNIPQGHELYYHLFNSTLKPQIGNANGYTSYTWEIKHIPAISSEKNQPDNHGNYPTLIFSTLDSYRDLVVYFNNQESFSNQESTLINEYINKLSLKKTDKNELIFALQDEVVKNMKLFPIPEEYTGYRLRTPEEVWKSNGGTVAEKAVLLTSMLKQAGIPAAPVFVFDGNAWDKKVGNLTILEEWVVQTKIPEKEPIYLSVKQVNAFDMTALLAGQVFMVLNPDGSYTIKEPKAEKSAATMKGIFNLDPDHVLSGDITGELTGRLNPYLALLRENEKIKHYFSGFSSSDIPHANLLELAPQKSSFSCQVNKKNMLKKDSSFYFFSIPLLKTGIESDGIHILEAKRATPFKLSAPIEENYEFTIAIPEDLTLITNDMDISTNNKIGSFVYQVKQKKGTVLVKKSLHIKEATITPEDYQDFKELMDNWNLRQTGELIFRK